MTSYGKDNNPFFVLGCVRSGTTMLRDFLRLHPRLECPEETHFYRWADPYGSPRYENYMAMKLFESHRRLDGISNKDFHDARFESQDRSELSEAYGKLYLRAVGNPQGRWFDKTPQNIYGIFLLSHQFPNSKFIHIYRHPLNVVASLVEGKVMAAHSVKGAVNYWLESCTLMQEYKRLYSNRVFELAYEDVAENPEQALKNVFDFIDEDFSKVDKKLLVTHSELNKYKQVLSSEDITYVQTKCSSYLEQYGYAPQPEVIA